MEDNTTTATLPTKNMSNLEDDIKKLEEELLHKRLELTKLKHKESGRLKTGPVPAPRSNTSQKNYRDATPATTDSGGGTFSDRSASGECASDTNSGPVVPVDRPPDGDMRARDKRSDEPVITSNTVVRLKDLGTTAESGSDDETSSDGSSGDEDDPVDVLISAQFRKTSYTSQHTAFSNIVPASKYALKPRRAAPAQSTLSTTLQSSNKACGPGDVLKSTKAQQQQRAPASGIGQQSSKPHVGRDQNAGPAKAGLDMQADKAERVNRTPPALSSSPAIPSGCSNSERTAPLQTASAAAASRSRSPTNVQSHSTSAVGDGIGGNSGTDNSATTGPRGLKSNNSNKAVVGPGAGSGIGFGESAAGPLQTPLLVRSKPVITRSFAGVGSNTGDLRYKHSGSLLAGQVVGESGVDVDRGLRGPVIGYPNPIRTHRPAPAVESSPTFQKRSVSNRITRSITDATHTSSASSILSRPPFLDNNSSAMSHAIERTRSSSALTNASKSTSSLQRGPARSESSTTLSVTIDHIHVRTEEQAEQIQKRFQILTGILKNETSYNLKLTIFLQKLKNIEASLKTSKPMMQHNDYDALKSRFFEIHQTSERFKRDLGLLLDNFQPVSEAWEPFQELYRKFYYYKEYADNLEKARAVVSKLQRKKNPAAEALLSIKVENMQYSLDQILMQPITHQTQFLQDVQILLQNTPPHHSDYDKFRSIIHRTMEDMNHGSKAQLKLRRNRRPGSVIQPNAWKIVKNAVMVEWRSGKRKMCHVILFTNSIVCIKYEETNSGDGIKMRERDIRWKLPLNGVKVEAEPDGTIELGVDSKQLEDWKHQIMQFRTDLNSKNSLIKQHNGTGKEAKAAKKDVAKLQKKIFETQSNIILNAPCLGIRFSPSKDDGSGGNTTMDKLLLTTSDYEREDWIGSIQDARHKLYMTKDGFKHIAFSSSDDQTILHTANKNRPSSACMALAPSTSTQLAMGIGNTHVLAQPLTGVLMCTVHKASGFFLQKQPAASIEADIFGHFETKARTGPSEKLSKTPEWRDATFEIDLDGSTALNILLYEPKLMSKRELALSHDQSLETLLAKGKVNLLQLPQLVRNRETVKSKFNLSDHIQVEVTLEFQPRETLLRRTRSRKRNGVFGKPLESLAKRSPTGELVPEIVRMCLAEVERRGLRTQGIYRQNGPAQKLQQIRSLFESGKKTEARRLLSNVDIHCVTGLLKLFFRQLPKPLFTDDLYRKFISAITQSDEGARSKEMEACIRSLPKANYLTLTRLVEHFELVMEHEVDNKMNGFNLATVFGPTLLWPDQTNGMGIECLNDVHYQNEILLFCIEHSSLFSVGFSERAPVASASTSSTSSTPTSTSRSIGLTPAANTPAVRPPIGQKPFNPAAESALSPPYRMNGTPIGAVQMHPDDLASQLKKSTELRSVKQRHRNSVEESCSTGETGTASSDKQSTPSPATRRHDKTKR